MTEKHFTQLCEILDTLLGPNGCPWDQKQTLQTLRQYVLEETCEVIDAICDHDIESLKEELGDLFFNVIFLAKVAAKEGHFTLEETLKGISDKLIRRHPHIFSTGKKLTTPDEVLKQWEAIKKEEKKSTNSEVSGIPKSLPALSRAQKLLSKMQKADVADEEITANSEEDQIGQKLFSVVAEAKRLGVDPEAALRKVTLQKEKKFVKKVKV